MPDTPLNPDALDMRAYDEALLAFKKVTPLYPGQAVALKDAVMAYAKHLAVAQPEVNSLEAIPAHVQVISWEEEPEHECWKLAPDETFVGLIVKSDRAWSPADKYTLNIERTIPHKEES